MKKNNFLLRIASVLLAVLLLLPMGLTAWAAEAKTVRIATVEDLVELAERCSSDSYSKGLTVLLTADLDLSGTEVSLPVFLGTFDGDDHTIRGLRLQGSNSIYGLFSLLQSTAVVKNLHVEGEITPSGTQSSIGGIAGQNFGRIENCTFSGAVIANSSVGGIVGQNGSGGVLVDCSVSGAVCGASFTGGIAGQNAGTLLRCSSAAAVNTAVEENSVTPAGMESTLYSLLKRQQVTETAVASDTGGITGFSTGIIQSCTNTGAVGYPHVGYNIGGIAGRQNGYMASCVNHGTVQGRKDVGGIVGQMAPDITMQYSSGGIDELQTELNKLQSLIDGTLNDAQSASDTVSGRISRISNYADSARQNAHSLTGQLGDFADSNIETANNLLLLAERYIAKAAPILDDLADASDHMASAADEMQTLFDQLQAMSGDVDQVLENLQSFADEMQQACTDMADGAAQLGEAFRLLGELPDDFPDTTQLDADLANFVSALSTLNKTIQKAMDEYEESGSVSSETQEQLKADLCAAFDCWSNVIDDLDEILQNTDFGALRDQTLETLKKVANCLQSAASSFSSAASHTGNAMDHLRQALEILRSMEGQTDEVLDQMDVVLEELEQASASLSSGLKNAAQWARDLSQEEPGRFSGLGSDFDSSSDSLNASLSGLGNELSALNTELSSSNTTLIADLRAVNNQFMKVMNLFLNLLNDTQNVDYSEVFEDVSDQSLQSATRGKALECLNYGSVNGDRNTGGIAGSMAIEYDTDPEDDLLSGDGSSLRFTYQTRAILMSCENYGTVEAKKSCAGGIVGRMDLGTVYGCGGWGNTSSESGDYVGGVAGLSISSIRQSYAKCTLSGGKYVGGIAGSGSRITGCYAMPRITAYTQLGGAIAGEATGTCSGNYFVSDTLAGVDRISYSGQAEPLTYEALCAISSLPENFRRLTLTFVADGDIRSQQDFAYGASFGSEVFPRAPYHSGNYSVWDQTDLTDLRFDTVVTAVYHPYVTTLSSDVLRQGKAILMVEGEFKEGDALQTGAIAAPEELSNDEVLEAWSVTIPEDMVFSHTVHWLMPEENGHYAVYVHQGGQWVRTKAETFGSYLCFNMSGTGEFAVTPAPGLPGWVWAAGVGTLALVVGLVLAFGRRKKSSQPAPSAAAESSGSPSE